MQEGSTDHTHFISSENVAVLKIKFKGGIQFDKYGNPLPASESKPV